MPVGALTVTGTGDLARSDFTYDPEFMYGEHGFDLAPRVRRADGEHSTRHLPFFIEDAVPDRWGEHLLRRQAQQHDPLRNLDRFDCIIGANDFARQGALRIANPNRDWIAAGGVPAHIELEALLDAADQVVADDDSFAAFATLLETGKSALGGARPKASVVDPDNRLWMAKFPQAGDRHDVPLWEKATLRVSREVGIDVPESKLLPVCGRNVLVVRRFDRQGGRRVPYQSVRTLLNNPDDGSRPPDHVQIATAVRAATGIDQRQYLRRVIFSIFVNNTHDHLRNTGLLRIGDEWRLAPAFDVNPEPDAGKPRHTSVAGGNQAGTAAAGLQRLAAASAAGRDLAEEVDRLSGVGSRLVEVAEELDAPSKELGRFSQALSVVRGAALAAAIQTAPARSGAARRRRRANPATDAPIDQTRQSND